MLAHHQFNFLSSMRQLKEEKESKDFGPFNIIWTSLFSPCFSPCVAFKLPGQFSKAKDWTGSGMTGTYQNDPNPTQLQAKRCSSQLNYLPVEQLMRSWSPADGSRYPPLLELLCKFKMPALPCMSCCKQALIAELRFQEVFSPINPVLRGIISLFCTVL